jgi:hypothetical protein
MLQNPENKSIFAVIVDGEVAFNWAVPTEIEMMCAALKSDPKIVEIPEELIGSVNQGWTYGEDGFSPPA